jgi:hypothetical protein
MNKEMGSFFGWRPGKGEPPGERWSTEEEYSLRERIQMLERADRLSELTHRLRINGSESYGIWADGNFFRAILTLPKPLAEILDDVGVPRTYTKQHFIPLHGPVQLFVGPPEREIYVQLRRVVPGYVRASEGFGVQPLTDPVPNLPVFRMASPEAWADTLRSLVKLHPID